MKRRRSERLPSNLLGLGSFLESRDDVETVILRVRVIVAGGVFLRISLEVGVKIAGVESNSIF